MAQKFTVPITVKQLTSTGSDAVTIYVDADTYARLKLEAGGRLVWGDGTSAGDTNLYRDSANVLKTDDTFKAPVLFIDDIEVDTTGATTDQVLKFNGTKFVPGTASTVGSIDDLSDVTITSASVNQVLQYNGTQWVNALSGATVTVSETAPASPTEGDLWFESDTAKTFIYYDSQWIEVGAQAPNGASALTTKGDILSRDSSTFARLAVGTNGYFLKADSSTATGLTWSAIPTINNLDDIGDVTITSASVGQVLKWNGTAWINDSDVSGSSVGALDDLSDTIITAPEEFQTLEYDGTNWVNAYASTVTYVRNAEATTLTTGTVVYLFGATGDHATVKRADKASDTTSSKTVGLIGANIAASQNGPVITRGYVDGIDLSVGYSSGDVLWLGSNGQFTKTKAVAPDHLVFVGVVVRATNNGIIYVATQNGYELDELHNVSATSPNSGDFLKYNGSLWVSDVIDLGTDTTGSYIATLSGTANQISVSGSGGESASVTIGLPSDVIISNDLTVTGNLTVNGTTTTLNTETLAIEDNIIVLNSNVSASPTLNAGIEVERGTSTNVQLRWNETTDKWQFTNDGSTYTDLGAGGAIISETAPASPTAGQVWFESDTAQTYVYYDSQWIEIGASPGIASVSESAPGSPTVGQLWFDSSAGATNIYYDSQWIEIGGGGATITVSDTAPTSPAVGQVWFNSSDGGTYVYYDSNWAEIGAVPPGTLNTVIDAKGDLLVGTANDTLARLATGTNDQVLTVDTSTATGLKWSTPTTYATTGKAIAMAIVFGG